MKLTITVNLVSFKDRFPPFGWMGRIIHERDLLDNQGNKILNLFDSNSNNIYKLEKSKGKNPYSWRTYYTDETGCPIWFISRKFDPTENFYWVESVSEMKD